MPFFKIIKSPNQQSEESNDTPHVPTAGMSGQHFYKELFQNAVGDKKNNGLSTQFLIDAGATYSIINSETFTEINTIQPLVVSPLEKSPLAANGHAMPMKGKTTIQSAFDVEYSCVIEHMVFVSDTPEARMNVLGIDFLAKFDEFINLINPMLILTVLSGKCVKLSPYLDKLFLTFHKLTRWNTSQKKESSGKPRKRKWRFNCPVVENSEFLHQDVWVTGPSSAKFPRIENSVFESLRASLREGNNFWD